MSSFRRSQEEELWQQIAEEPPVLPTKPMSEIPKPGKDKPGVKPRPKESPDSDLVQTIFHQKPFWLTFQLILIVGLAVDAVGGRIGNPMLLYYGAVAAGSIAVVIGAIASNTRNLRRRNALFEVALPFGTTPLLLQFLLTLIQMLK